MKLAFFPGCSAKSSAEYAISALQLMKKLGIDIFCSDFNCCGTHIVEEYNRDIWLALNARNLSIAEEMGADIVTICPACYQNLKKAAILLEDESVRRNVNSILASVGRKYEGGVSVYHVLEIVKEFADEISVNSTLKVAAYYGCQILRPPEIGIDDAENPSIFEDFLKKVGFKLVKFKAKSDCCGGTLLLSNPEGFKSRSKSILDEAKKSGADCVATLCPLCQYSLEIVQNGIEVLPFTSLIVQNL